MKMNVTISLFHDTRRIKENKKYPVKLRITHNRRQKYYPYAEKYDLTKEDFITLNTVDPRKELKRTKEVFEAEKLRAQNIIDSLGHRFTFALFEKMFRQSSSSNNIFELLDERSKMLRANGRISSSVLFAATSKSLQSFYNRKVLALDAIDAAFLNEYEKWMIGQGNSRTTVGIYCRNIRTIYNKAINNRLVPRELYPFGSGDEDLYTIPTGKNIKKAIPASELKKIFEFKTTNESLAKARDFWILSYLGGGLNMRDIAHLKFKNINKQEKMVYFERSKTARSNKDKPVIITFALDENVKRIFSKWGSKSVYDGNYIFDILNNKMDADEVYKKVQLFVAFVNRNMKLIAKDLGILVNLTSYVARHSFARRLFNSGYAPHIIGKSMGQQSTKTTDNYFANISDGSKKKIAETLVDFGEASTL